MSISKKFVNLSKDLHEINKIESGFDVISEFTTCNFDFEGVVLLLDNRLNSAASDNIHSFYSYGFGLTENQKRLAKNKFYFGPQEKSILEGKKVVCIPDVSQRKAFFHPESIEHFMSVVILPLYVENRNLGVLYLTKTIIKELDTKLKNQLTTLLKIYSQNLSNIFSSVEAKTIVDISSEMNSLNTKDDLFSYLNSSLKDLFPNSRNVIISRDGNNYLERNIIEKAFLENIDLSKKWQLLNNIFIREKYKIWAGKYSKTSKTEQELFSFFNLKLIRKYFRNALIMPISSKNKLYGIIYIFDKRGKAFYKNHGEFLLPICSQISTVLSRIENDEKSFLEKKILSQKAVHEIKNPVEVIYTQLYLLKNEITEKKTITRLNKIKNQVDKIHETTDSFIKFSKIQQYNTQEHLLLTTLEKIKIGTQDIIINIKNKNNLKNIKYYSDEKEIMRVIEELIYNAKKNNATIIDIYIQDNTNNLIGITIHDNGSGINKNIIEDIFSPYISGNPQGSGIGLSISKTVLEYLGCTIELKSTSKEGTSFLIKIKKTNNEKVKFINNR